VQAFRRFDAPTFQAILDADEGHSNPYEPRAFVGGPWMLRRWAKALMQDWLPPLSPISTIGGIRCAFSELQNVGEQIL